MPVRAGDLAALAVAAALACTCTPAGASTPCPRLRVADALADRGSGMSNGAIVDVDLDQPPTQNTVIAGGSDLTAFMTHVAVARNRLTYVADMEADPAGIGPDAGGNPGPGAVFSLDPAGSVLALVADGTLCGPSITNCGPSGVFVDPIGLAWSEGRQLLVVADPDADPSGLGPDSLGHAGHGALLRVDPVTGQVDVLSDGSDYPAGIPTGEPSIFEDPIAVAFGWDGSLYVLDQLARPFGRDPGAIFRVDPVVGTVTLVSAAPELLGPRDLAAEPAGTILVLDRRLGPRGGLLRIDPLLPPQANVVASFAPPELVEPAGVVVAGNGEIFVADTAADPFGDPDELFHGAVFRIDPGLAAAVPVSSTAHFAAPWSLDMLEPLSLDVAAPGSGALGTSLTVRLTGGPWPLGVVADFGPDIAVVATRVISPTTLEVDIDIGPTAAVGLRDVRVVAAGNWVMAFHCELFEVNAIAGCPPQANAGDDLRVRKVDNTLVLEWSAPLDGCRAGFRVRRAYTARPMAHPGSWPVDPAFDDLTPGDLDGDATNPAFSRAQAAGRDEYFLVAPVGTDGTEGTVGSYGG